MPSPLPALLTELSWRQWRHQPLRHAVVVLAVALGVALAFAVHLINQSALGEFSAAVRQANGQPDFELRAQREGFDEALLERVATHPQVALASPVVEFTTQALDARGEPFTLRVLGLDTLAAVALTPALVPRPDAGEDRLALLDPGAIYLNAAAARRAGDGRELRLRHGATLVTLARRGAVAAEGPPLAVLDIAGAQASFGWLGRLSRIDVRLVPGADRARVLRELALPPAVRAAAPDESAQRISNLSRAYRLNLSVLSLVALFTGAFLVFSILSLSVTQRAPQLALLGVLGLSAKERLALVLAESGLLGLAGSALGLLLGTGLAQLALRLLGGDLGGAYFPGVQPTLQFSPAAALLYGALGVAVALAGGWLPARGAQQLAPARVLKGLGERDGDGRYAWAGPALLVLGAALAQLPPWGGIPLAAYLAVACLLLGGIACVPAGVGLLLRGLAPARHALWLLAVERARHLRRSATIAVAGVVASLALAVALTVMVASFRAAVDHWLEQVLPADLYARSAASPSPVDAVYLEPEFLAAVARLSGVARVEGQRVAQVQLDPQRPDVSVLARPLGDPAQRLPLLGALQGAPPGAVPAYASEPLAQLYGLQAGQSLELPLPDGRRARVFIRGVWRDYARQHGALALDAADWQRLTGDRRVNDLALWLAPGADAAAVQARLRELAGPGLPLEFSAPGEIRALSLRIFDRSFAVTYWLQAVAIAIGLAGIAASFSAQVLARRREFGLLAHLGLTRAQILAVVAGEGAVWSAAGVALGLLLGLAVAAVLVHVVNPQSFHWTMELLLPAGRLAALGGAMFAAGTLTAWWAGRAAASRSAVLAVKDDW